MARKRISKEERIAVYNKYNGHCAYCGKPIEYKDMQVDHLEAYWKGGDDNIENYMPACRSCNHYKRGNSLESFRRAIETIPAKLERDSYIYRIGLMYGNVVADVKPIRFYFERFEENDKK